MSLPPGFLDELRTRITLSGVVGRKVTWDMRKSNQGKGDMWAPCPFHQEKSASFHVDDRKGFYYCFGCQAKGDAISFVRETENASFMEAVEILAREAGMTMPARDPQEQARAEARNDLADITEMAVRFYRLALRQQGAVAARAYIDGRGLSAATQDRFEIGFAPDGNALFAHLTEKGIAPERIIDAGLAARPDDGRAPYDRFRGRIMFPIRDARGRCISFGGRAMDPAARAKYLNGPETVLFDKGRNLYNIGPAREASGKTGVLIVAEGYMDVIALAQAGFDATVAPLGTAVTEEQLRLMWRVADEPLIALDGDAAGLRAAYRLIDLALPMLEAGKSLRFAILPAGQDPDDLIRAGGAGAMQAVLDQALPMVQLLWRRETEGREFDSPERRAGLDKALRERLRTIQDPSVRGHYGQAVKDLRWQLFSAARRAPGQAQAQGAPGGRAAGMGRGGGLGGAAPQSGVWGGAWGGRGFVPRAASAGARASALAAGTAHVEEHLQEAVVLAVLVATPEVLPEFDTRLELLEFTGPDHAALRDVILRCAPDETPAEAITRQMGAAVLEALMAKPHVAICPAIRRAGDADQARMTLAEAVGKLSALQGLSAEIAEAAEDLTGLRDEAVTWRLRQAAEARDRAQRRQQEDKAEFETGPNGLLIDKEERNAFEALLNSLGHTRPRS